MSTSPSTSSLQKHPAGGQNHLPALDGVRGLAVFMVLVFHFAQGLHYLSAPAPVDQALRLLSLGQKGVDLFFVLSGFLITGILIRTKESPHYLRNFYVRRMLRIFPLYFAVVGVCLLCGWVFSLPNYSWSKGWWYLFYLQNFGMTFSPGAVGEPGHFWSLAVEEHFYFVWPFVVLWVPTRRLAVVSLAVILLAACSRVVLIRAGYDVFTFTLCRMDALALGAFLAACFRDAPRWNTISVGVKRFYWPLFLAGVPAFYIFSGTHHPVQQAVKYLVFAAFCGGLIILSLDRTPGALVPRVFDHRSLRFMGKISYAMYVFHPFIFGWLWRISTRPDWSPVRDKVWAAVLVDFAAAAGATILVAWLSWVLFESRVLKLKERFEYEPAQPADNKTRGTSAGAATTAVCLKA